MLRKVILAFLVMSAADGFSAGGGYQYKSSMGGAEINRGSISPDDCYPTHSEPYVANAFNSSAYTNMVEFAKKNRVKNKKDQGDDDSSDHEGVIFRSHQEVLMDQDRKPISPDSV